MIHRLGAWLIHTDNQIHSDSKHKFAKLFSMQKISLEGEKNFIFILIFHSFMKVRAHKFKATEALNGPQA